MLIPVSVPTLSGVGHLLTGVQNYNGSHTPTPLYLLHQGWLTCSHGYSDLHTAVMVIVMVNRQEKSMLNTGKDNAK